MFPGSEKRTPINKITHFINNFKHKDKYIHQIKVDGGGELSRSKDFVKLLLDNNINIQSTSGYNSWLNGKIERTHQTLMNMIN